MLLVAQNGDRLGAPTTGLGVGFFGAKENSFTFASENGLELWNYQGYGPYTLEMSNGQFRDGFSAQNMTSEHPFIGTDKNISKTWEQPLYNYTESGPQHTGFMRTVSYKYSGVTLNWGASSSIPALVGVMYIMIRKAAVKLGIGAAGGPVGEVVGGGLFIADIGVALNNGVNINYQLQVDQKDTRTYLDAASPCLFQPCWQAPRR